MFRATVALFIAAITGSVVLTLAQEAPGGRGITLLALAAALEGAACFVLHRALRDLTGTLRSRLYRIALAVAIAFGVLTYILTAHPTAGWVLRAISWLTVGSLVGAITASSRDYGLWEDNFPPSPDVLREVLRAHAAWVDDDGRTRFGKRAFDRIGSFLGLALLSPVAAAIASLLWLEDPGPLLFAKNSVGRVGSNFRQWKFRTMRRGAEQESGPVWSEREDQRVLRVGRVLRKTALDELPQLLNILLGQMSFVGPRPQRTVLVARVLETMPEYAARHRLAPGLAGLAQVAGHYYLTPRQKLRFDRLYIRHASLGFDLRLLLIAFAVVFWLRWRKDWNGRLPRGWLHARSAREPVG